MKESKAQLRLAFVCAGDPLNVLTWSGTPYHMLKALQSEFEITTIVRRPWPRWFELSRRALRRLTGGAIDIYWSKAWSRVAGRRAVGEIADCECDLVFAVAVTPLCAELIKRRPTVFVSDATLAAMVNYNPRHSALTPDLKRSAAELETFCIQNAVLSLFPSTWASGSAVQDHGGAPEKVLQIPWGANLLAEQIVAPEERSQDEWRLLFVGTSWMGKGADVALGAVAELRRRGHRVHIDMVGSLPEGPLPQIEGVTFHGFMDKNAPDDLARLRELFRSAHAFFLPTRFEALGIVFAEAASYAVPAVSYRTGGVPSVVIDGETGVLLDEGASAEAFADALASMLLDRRRYVEMCYAAKRMSQEHLNWPAWAAAVRRAIEGEMQKRSASS